MNIYQKSLLLMKELFGKDYQFALATSENNIPSVRFIDAFYDEGSLYVVTYQKSQKVEEINNNKCVSLTNRLYKFNGEAYNLGHPLDEKNQDIRKKLIKAFEPWYFEHNNEDDDFMCYLEIKLVDGFIYKDGIGYQINFKEKTVKSFPYDFDIKPSS